MIEITGSGTARIGISPTNRTAFGKAGDRINATATISIAGGYSDDYTRVPSRATRSGSAKAITIGRF
jgi:hypothetical protein